MLQVLHYCIVLGVKGILLAGGAGSRLGPLTVSTSKHLLAVHDKPMIYYSFSTLLMTGVTEIALIHKPRDKSGYEALLGDGSDFGVKITYIEQAKPLGISHAFILAKDFLDGDSCALILGDNIFYGAGLGTSLHAVAKDHIVGARVFLKAVSNPQDYGVALLEGDVIASVVEKPANPASNLAVTGLYLFDDKCVSVAASLEPSARGELEITHMIDNYREKNSLSHTVLGRGLTWVDAGTVQRIEEASELIRLIQSREGLMVGSPEEIALGLGNITNEQLSERASTFGRCDYAAYLINLAHLRNSN
jgi:glucose-1-phosphate thymidylyltransferase